VSDSQEHINEAKTLIKAKLAQVFVFRNSIPDPVPKKETIEAIKAARRGELIEVDSPDKLLESLNADD
jgi:hypothetical protein